MACSGLLLSLAHHLGSCRHGVAFLRCPAFPSRRLTQGATPSPFPPTSLHVSMCLNPGSMQKSCIPWQCPRAPCKSVEITAGMWFCPALSFQSNGDLVSVTISVCSFVKGFPVSESLHSQSHQCSQSGYQPHGTSHAARDGLPLGGNPGLGSQKKGRYVSSTGKTLAKKDSKEDGLKRV